MSLVSFTSLPDHDSLRDKLLRAAQPQLKAPDGAMLCPDESLIVNAENGSYRISGYVSSQNSYGVYLRLDLTANARYINNDWTVDTMAVGVQTAQNNAKTFLSNYIAISIFVGVMGILGTIILMAITKTMF